MFQTIKDKMVFSSIAFPAVIALSILVFNYHLLTRYMRECQEEKLLFTAELIANHIDHELAVREEVIQIIAQSSQMDIYHRKRIESELIEYFFRFSEEFPVLGLVDYDGTKQYWTEDGRITNNRADISHDSLITTAIANPGEVVNNIMNASAKGTILRFAFAVETYFDEPIGVLVGEVPLKDLTITVFSISDIKVGKDGFPVVASQYGDILYHPDSGMVAKKLHYSGKDTAKLLSSTMSSNKVFGRYQFFGTDSFIAFAPVKEIGWSLMLVLPYEEFIAMPTKLRNFSFVFSAVLLLAVGYLAIRFGRQVSESLGRLSELVKHIARGDLTRKAAVDSTDELGELGESLNMMSKALRISKEEVELANASTKNLLKHLLTVREDERKHISYRVHNELSQAMVTMKLNLAWMERKLPKNSEELAGKLEETSEMVESMAAMAQDITSSLRPLMLDDLGLEAAINWQADKFEKSTGIKCRVDIALGRLPPGKGISEILFRACQEALTNVARHAGATEVGISLSAQNGRALLVVRDNGKGITEEEINSSTSYGLIGMRESIQTLGGEFQVSGEEDNGTTLSASVPLKAEKGQTP